MLLVGVTCHMAQVMVLAVVIVVLVSTLVLGAVTGPLMQYIMVQHKLQQQQQPYHPQQWTIRQQQLHQQPAKSDAVASEPPDIDLTTALLPEHHPAEEQGRRYRVAGHEAAGAVARRSTGGQTERPVLAGAVPGTWPAAKHYTSMPVPVLHAPSLDQMSYRSLDCHADAATAAAAARASPANGGSYQWRPAHAAQPPVIGLQEQQRQLISQQQQLVLQQLQLLLPSTQQQPQYAGGPPVDALSAQQCAPPVASSSAVGTYLALSQSCDLEHAASDSSQGSSWEQPFNLAADAAASFAGAATSLLRQALQQEQQHQQRTSGAADDAPGATAAPSAQEQQYYLQQQWRLLLQLQHLQQEQSAQQQLHLQPGQGDGPALACNQYGTEYQPQHPQQPTWSVHRIWRRIDKGYLQPIFGGREVAKRTAVPLEFDHYGVHA